MGYVTLSEDNQFTFKCPIFNVNTKMASCMKLKTLFWRGKRPEQRKGCQACMSANKCPAAHIAQRIGMAGIRSNIPDDYGSETPVLGKLRKDILERIENVMVLPNTLRQFGVPMSEIKLIETASTRISALVGNAPVGSKPTKTSVVGSPRGRAKIKDNPVNPVETKTAVQKAAETGDLSAAI